MSNTLSSYSKINASVKLKVLNDTVETNRRGRINHPKLDTKGNN